MEELNELDLALLKGILRPELETETVVYEDSSGVRYVEARIKPVGFNAELQHRAFWELHEDGTLHRAHRGTCETSEFDDYFTKIGTMASVFT